MQGRTKELINRGGAKVSPERVEQVLMSFPGVADAAVFAIPDDVYGERIAAVILARNGFHVTPTDLTSYCRDRLAPFEIPERIAFADQLPLTPKAVIAAGGYAGFATDGKRRLGSALTTTDANNAIMGAMATLRSAPFRWVLCGAGRSEPHVPAAAAKAIARVGRRINRYCSARMVCFGTDLHLLEAVGAEQAATCSKFLDHGMAA